MSGNRPLGWAIALLTAIAAAAKPVLRIVQEIRTLFQRLRKLEQEVGDLRVQNLEQENRIKHLEEQLQNATNQLQLANAENIRLKTELISIKHERNKQANLAALRGELLRMHGIDPEISAVRQNHVQTLNSSDGPNSSVGSVQPADTVNATDEQAFG